MSFAGILKTHNVILVAVPFKTALLFSVLCVCLSRVHYLVVKFQYISGASIDGGVRCYQTLPGKTGGSSALCDSGQTLTNFSTRMRRFVFKTLSVL